MFCKHAIHSSLQVLTTYCLQKYYSFNLSTWLFNYNDKSVATVALLLHAYYVCSHSYFCKYLCLFKEFLIFEFFLRALNCIYLKLLLQIAYNTEMVIQMNKFVSIILRKLPVVLLQQSNNNITARQIFVSLIYLMNAI